MHVIKLNGYNATTETENGEKLELGTFDSYGEEQLQIVEAPDWENLSVIATFNPPYKKPVQAVVDSVTGVVKVPKEAGRACAIHCDRRTAIARDCRCEHRADRC